jgi:hypothetical protein
MPAAASAAPSPQFWGVDYNYGSLPQADLDQMVLAGVGSARITIYRPQVEAREGHFDWSAPDQMIGDLASRGIEAEPVLFGSPSYAAKTVATPPLDSQSARDSWQRFVRAAVARYRPDGTYWTLAYPLQHPTPPPLPVRTWQIWNEPNISNFFQPRPSVKRYAKLVKLTSDEIRASDGDATVLLAGMPGLVDFKPWRFLDRFFRVHGIKRRFDGVALHPYAPSVPKIKSQFLHTRRVLRRHHAGALPIYVTELGWGSRKRGGRLNLGRKGQARMLQKSFTLILRHRTEWHVPRLDWYTWRDVPKVPGRCSFCNSAGLLTKSYRKKPAWREFVRFTGVR